MAAPLALGAVALAEAARALMAVAHDGFSAERALALVDTHPDRRAIRAIALGAMRWYLRLAPAIARLIERPFADLAPPVQALLVVCAHQIEHSRNPAESIVHRAVDGARALGVERAAGLVNAVMRRFVRERVQLLAAIDTDLAARTAHPDWLVEALRGAWPQQCEAILDANNGPPPMTVRVDRTRTSVADFLEELAVAGIEAQAIEWCPSAVVLTKPVAVAMLPGFREGRVSVQDAGAQLAAPLLDAQPRMRVLDACAAPGGKTGHLLEYTPGLTDLVALDVDAGRLARVGENLERLRRTARLVVADVRNMRAALAREVGEEPFDRILLDAPCSSTGVIRRHPDIKLLRRESDIAPFAATQLELLRAAFQILRSGGRLLYATCSVLPQENGAVVSQFLREEPAARGVAAPPAVALPPDAAEQPPGVQLLPGGEAMTDGFYYALLEKAPAAGKPT
ncbi:MAG TPA: 16S rRNA (cytosine(967)-C(5))-methyltransferase RsmB [Steroidobacteraceae bacterium]